jgi:integral membrane sensor domain MASE1
MSGAAAGASLMRRFCNDQYLLNSGRSVLVFVLVGALGGCMINSTVGVLVLALAGKISWGVFGYAWLTWWIGDATGVIVAASLILAWCDPNPLPSNSRWDAFEAAALGGISLLLCYFVFFNICPSNSVS